MVPNVLPAPTKFSSQIVTESEPTAPFLRLIVGQFHGQTVVPGAGNPNAPKTAGQRIRLQTAGPVPHNYSAQTPTSRRDPGSVTPPILQPPTLHQSLTQVSLADAKVIPPSSCSKRQQVNTSEHYLHGERSLDRLSID